MNVVGFQNKKPKNLIIYWHLLWVSNKLAHQTDNHFTSKMLSTWTAQNGIDVHSIKIKKRNMPSAIR